MTTEGTLLTFESRAFFLPLEEPGRIREEGGPYADVLDVVFPKEKTKQVMAVVRSLEPDEGEN
jgi:hypothetical protein